MKAVVIGLSLLLATNATARPTPADKCEAGKYRVTSRYALCRARAEGKRILGADPSKYTRALANCADALTTNFARLEGNAMKKGARCPTTGDVPLMKKLADVYLVDVGWQLAALQLRIVDKGDGTITDNHTGLMWEKKIRLVNDVPGASADYSDLHDANNGYHWSGLCTGNFALCQPTAEAAAACTAGVQGGNAGCAVCGASDAPCMVESPDNPGETTIWQWLVDLNAANFAGYHDWRIPTLAELLTIVDYSQVNPSVSAYPFQGASCGPTCTNLNDPACSCTIPFLHFTSTTSSSDARNAWWVEFGGGETGSILKSSDMWIRAVRGP